MSLDLFPLVRPLLHAIDAERAHNITISCLKMGLNGVIGSTEDPDCLRSTVFGLTFPNPVGLGAGFDKNAEVITGAHKMGFGFAEAGTVTPLPQVGNDKPRLFRLKEDKAVINRFGFNNKGLPYFSRKLKRLTPMGRNGGKPFGANVGANKLSTDKTADYITGIEALYGLSDYFTVNISSPNTPGLRSLQSKEALTELVEKIMAARQKKMDSGERRIPILVKIAPDLTRQDIKDIADTILSFEVDGLIVSNTTITRPVTSNDPLVNETGGLSGPPLMPLATQALIRMYEATEGKIPLIGVGGIASGADAYTKIRAGASLVQLYSALVYEGPALVARIKSDLVKFLEKDGFSNIADAVGADHRQ